MLRKSDILLVISAVGKDLLIVLWKQCYMNLIIFHGKVSVLSSLIFKVHLTLKFYLKLFLNEFWHFSNGDKWFSSFFLNIAETECLHYFKIVQNNCRPTCATEGTKTYELICCKLKWVLIIFQLWKAEI